MRLLALGNTAKTGRLDTIVETADKSVRATDGKYPMFRAGFVFCLAPRPAACVLAILLMSASLICAKEPQAAIDDTGSTNRLGLRVVFDQNGDATVQPRRGDPQQVKLDPSQCEQFLRDLKALAPLTDLPVNHCVKSVSFGSSLFVELDGDRSPDISCASQDTRIEELKKQAQELLGAARQAANIPSRRAFPTAPK